MSFESNNNFLNGFILFHFSSNPLYLHFVKELVCDVLQGK